MAQWVKVGNIRGPAGEIPDTSDFLKLTYPNNTGTKWSIKRLDGTAEISAESNSSGSTFMITDSFTNDILKLRVASGQAFIVINNKGVTGFIDEIKSNTRNDTLPTTLGLKNYTAGMVKATTDEEYGTGASLLTSDGKVVDSVVFPGTDESIASIGSDYFFINKDTNTVEFNVADYEGLKRATAAFYVKNAADEVTSYLEIGCSNENQTNVGTEGNPVDLLYAADLDDAATDKRVPNKKYVDDAIAAIDIPDTSSMLALNSANNLTKNGEEVRNFSVVKDGYNGLTLTTGGTNDANQLLLQTFQNDGANYGQFHVDTGPSAVNFYMATEGATLGLYCDANGSSVGTTENPAGKVFVEDITDTETADGDLAVNLRTLKGMLTGDSGFITRDENYILKAYIDGQLYNLPQLNLRGNTGSGYINTTANGGGGVIELGGNSTSKVELQNTDDGGYIRLKTLFDHEPEIATNGKLTISDKSISSITDDASSGSTTALTTAKAVKDYADGLVSFVTDEQIDEYLEYDSSVNIDFDLINNDMGTVSCSIDETGTVTVSGGTISWGGQLSVSYNTWATIPDVTVPSAYRPTSDTIFNDAANGGGYTFDIRFNTDGTIDVRRTSYPSYPATSVGTITISGEHTYQSTPPAQEGAPDLGNGIMTAEQVLSRLGGSDSGGSVKKLFEGSATSQYTVQNGAEYTLFAIEVETSDAWGFVVVPIGSSEWHRSMITSTMYINARAVQSSQNAIVYISGGGGAYIRTIYGIK